MFNSVVGSVIHRNGGGLVSHFISLLYRHLTLVAGRLHQLIWAQVKMVIFLLQVPIQTEPNTIQPHFKLREERNLIFFNLKVLFKSLAFKACKI